MYEERLERAERRRLQVGAVDCAPLPYVLHVLHVLHVTAKLHRLQVATVHYCAPPCFPFMCTACTASIMGMSTLVFMGMIDEFL